MHDEVAPRASDAPFLTEAEAARLLRISERSLQRWRVEGGGPRYVRAGRRVLYRRSDLEGWAEGRTFAHSAAEWAAKAVVAPERS